MWSNPTGTVVEGNSRYYGLTAQVVDYRNFQRHPDGTIGWAYLSDEAGVHPQGYPLWKSLWYDTIAERFDTDRVGPTSNWSPPSHSSAIPSMSAICSASAGTLSGSASISTTA